MKLTSIVFGTVHSARTVVVLLHKHFSSWLSTFCNSISITMNCMYANISESHIMASVNNLFNFFKSPYYVYFSIWIVSCQIFTWTALGDIDLCIYVFHSFW